MCTKWGGGGGGALTVKDFVVLLLKVNENRSALAALAGAAAAGADGTTTKGADGTITTGADGTTAAGAVGSAAAGAAGATIAGAEPARAAADAAGAGGAEIDAANTVGTHILIETAAKKELAIAEAFMAISLVRSLSRLILCCTEINRVEVISRLPPQPTSEHQIPRKY